MSAIITTKTRLDTAKKFIETLGESYFFAAKIDPWTDENSPDLVTLDTRMCNDTKKQMIFMKQAAATGVRGLKRFDWVTGTIYTPWDSEPNLYFQRNWLSEEQPFYVFVQDTTSGNLKNNIYLCLDNNNGGPSTIKPTGQSIDVFTTIDGYKWKFMYEIDKTLYEYINAALIPYPLTDAQKSATHLSVEENLDPGTIDRIQLVTSGTGFVSNPTITITGDGAGATAAALVENGSITRIDIINPGVNYTFATVEITGGGGSGASARPVISPPFGHGSDSAHQLCATHIMSKQAFVANEADLFLEVNSYRKIGLIKNVTDLAGVALDEVGYSFLDKLTVASISAAFPLVQEIVGNTLGSRARINNIVTLSPTSAEFYITDRRGNFLIDEYIQLADDPGTLAQVVDVDYVDINRKSGDIIYIEHLQFVTRKFGRTESFIFSIEF